MAGAAVALHRARPDQFAGLFIKRHERGLLAAGRPLFDRDTYKILAKYVARMIPLTLARPPTTKE